MGEVLMEVVYSRCAGLDVHKKTVVACAITPKSNGGWNKEIKTFGTMTSELLQLSDWLTARECTYLAMESAGEYWRPVFNILEANFEVLLVNAQHIKNVPRRKTDIKDTQLIGELLMYGLLCASFIPPIDNTFANLRGLNTCRSSVNTSKSCQLGKNLG
ncbi:MAG TPA: transposase [Nostocaceae cyanobacterium]|nr:transposase [Nostocaceae cyanobacterium]